jgi:chemotaxis response regulator CheB
LAPFEPERSAAERDIVVIGASTGGFEAIQRILADLPADLPAALFIVIHRGSADPDLLVRALRPASSLPVLEAAEGQQHVRGHVYVARRTATCSSAATTFTCAAARARTARARRSIRCSAQRRPAARRA